MKREDTLPPIFAQFEPLVHYVQKRSSTRWTSTCPTCGGEIHPDGEFPDRCVWFMQGKPLGFCFRCRSMFWPDQAPNYKPPSVEELDQWRREREAEEQGRLAEAQRRLDYLTSNELWVQYHDMMDDHARRWWAGRGVPVDYQNFWSLGWDHDSHRWGCPSATIPLFGPDWKILNIKHRLADDSKGRYRYNVSGLDAPMFLCDPDMELDGHVIACEGEVKSMVVAITLDDPAAVVVGIPGLNPSPAITDTLAKADQVTLVLDPGSDTPGKDGWSPMGRLIRDIGREKTRILIPPVKIDDGILMCKLSKREVVAMLDAAVKS